MKCLLLLEAEIPMIQDVDREVCFSHDSTHHPKLCLSLATYYTAAVISENCYIITSVPTFIEIDYF